MNCTQTSGRGVTRRPVEEVADLPGVDDALGFDLVADRLVAAEDLPLELTGRVGVGVDRDLAVPLEREGEQLVGRILSFGAAVDLDRGVEAGARGEDDLGIE